MVTEQRRSHDTGFVNHCTGPSVLSNLRPLTPGILWLLPLSRDPFHCSTPQKLNLLCLLLLLTMLMAKDKEFRGPWCEYFAVDSCTFSQGRWFLSAEATPMWLLWVQTLQSWLITRKYRCSCSNSERSTATGKGPILPPNSSISQQRSLGHAEDNEGKQDASCFLPFAPTWENVINDS